MVEKSFDKYKYSTKSTTIQVCASVLASAGMFLSGMVLGFPSAILGPLVDTHTMSFHATVEEGSWVSSVAAIASPIGCLLGGPLIDKFGRRRGLQLLNIPNFIGFCMLALVPFPFQNLYLLIIGRILTGFGIGLAHCAAVTYTAEVVTPHLRTLLVTLAPVMMGIGIFVIYFLADLFRDQWTIAACVGIAVSVFSAIFTPFLPESPLWLLSKNSPEKALKSLMIMRGTASRHIVEEEFSIMTNSVSSRKTKAMWKSTLQDMCKPEAYKPLIIMNMFFLFQQFSGITIIIVYGVQFAKDAEIPNDAYTVALFIGVVRVISTFITTWVCGRWGRRRPAVLSGIGTSLTMLVLIIYLFLRHNYPTSVPETAWIPAICILLNIFTTSIGFSTLPWSMLGEVFPTSVRGVSSGLTSCFAYFLSFIALKFYPIIEPVVGNIAVFGFFGVSSIVGTIFLAIFLPETHGKTLQDIEDYFKASSTAEQV